MPECHVEKKNWIAVFRIKATVKLQKVMNVCWNLSPELLNLLLPKSKLPIVTHHHEQEWKDWFAVFKVKVTMKASLGQIIIWTADP